MPLAEVSAKRVADGQAVLLRPALVDHRAVVPEPGRDGVVARRPSRSATASPRMVLTVSLSPNASAAVLADGRHVHAGAASSVAADGGIGRRPAVRAGDHVARRRRARSSEPRGRVLQARGDDRDQRDERHADRQRRRGGHRPAGLAHRVAPGEPARRAAERLRRAAEQRGEGAHRRAPAAAPGRRPARPSRSAATGAHPRRPPGGQQPGERASRPCRRAATRRSCRAANTVPASGSDSCIASNSASSAFASPSPATSPTAEASTPMASASTSTRAEHLPARGADHPQQPELARALGDGDRERVEDRERADQHRHAAEHEQRDPDDRDELLEPVEGEAVLRRRRSATCASGERRRPRSARSAPRARPSRPATRMPSTWSPRPNSACAVARSKTADVAVPIDLTVPKRATPTTSNGARRAARR